MLYFMRSNGKRVSGRGQVFFYDRAHFRPDHFTSQHRSPRQTPSMLRLQRLACSLAQQKQHSGDEERRREERRRSGVRVRECALSLRFD